MNRYRKLGHALFHRKQIGFAVFAAVLALAAYPAWRVWAAGGALDTSFSGDGKYTLPLAFPASETGYAHNVDEVLIQPDPNNTQVERVIAAYSNAFGYIMPDASFDFLVTRLTQSGTKDSSFGNNGYAAINFDSTGLPTSKGNVTALALQPNGKILVAGNLSNSAGSVAALARLTVDGDLDNSFSDDGLWFFFGPSQVSDMVLQADGKILLAGRMEDSTGTYWKSALWRFNADGTTDASFGTLNGAMSTTVWPGSPADGGKREGFRSIFVQSDGKIVALNNTVTDCGICSIYDPPAHGYRLRRFTASGALDSTLQVNAVAGDRGNSIKAVGSKIWVVGSSGDYGAIFARNSSNGALDTSFGNNGKVASSQPSVWMDSAFVPFSLPGRYVIVGFNIYPGTLFGPQSKSVVTQYFSSGALDSSFGNNGSAEGAINSRYASVRVGLSGKIVAGGQASSGLPGTEQGLVARYWGN